MAKNTITRRVNLYINGQEAGNDIKSVRGEMQKLVNEQARLQIGSDKYVEKGKRIRELKAILNQHNQQLQATKRNWFSLSAATDGFNKYFGMIGSFLAGLTGVVLGFRKCSDEAGKFEENLDNLSALTGLEGKDLEWLGDQAKEMSVKTTEAGIKIKQSATDILDAFTKMGSQRPELLKNKEALAAVTEDAIILSEAAKMKLEPAAASLANVMNQFNTTSAESRRIINELAAGSQAGSGDIQYLSDAIEKCGTTAYLLGMQTNQAVGLIEAIAPKFKEASMAGNSLDKVLLKLKEKQVGYKDGVFNLNSALDELETRFARGESSADMFGVEHAKMAEVLVMAKGDVVKYTEAVTGTEKALEQAAKNTNNRVAERAQAMNKLKLKMIEVGEKIAPAITVSTNAFTYFLNALVKAPQFYNENKQLIFALVAALVALQGKTILATAATLKGHAVHLLDAAAKMKNGLATNYLNTYTEQYNKTQGRLYPALLKARTGFVMLGRAMLANPIGAVVLAFTALKAAIDYYDKNNATSVRLEKEKKVAMDNLNTTVEALSGKYKEYQSEISTLNRLSLTEKKDLRDKINLTIQSTEAEIANYKAKQLSIQKDNERAGTWEMLWAVMRRNPFAKNAGMDKVFGEMQEKALKNGKKAAEELNPGLEKLEETLAKLKSQEFNLAEIFNAETNADKIGTKTITELQEKVNLYRTALENATLQSEEYDRIQRKLISTEAQLNKAIKAREIPEQVNPKKADKKDDKEASLAKEKEKLEKDLSNKIRDIRNKLHLETLTEGEKEIFEAQVKYNELLHTCRMYGLDATEVIKAYTDEMDQLFENSMLKEVSDCIAAQEKIDEAIQSASAKQKSEIRKRYSELIDLAEKYGIDTTALKAKMEKELEKSDRKAWGADLFGMTEEDWTDMQDKITMAIDMAGQLSDVWGQFNQIQSNREQKELQQYEINSNKKKDILNKQLNAGRISQEQYNARVAQLDADLDRKKTETAKKEAKRNKAQSIFSAIINTASAVVQALNSPWPASLVFAALAGAMGAAQVAVIASNPLPEFAEGGLTDGAKMYVAGEAGQEWISPNWMLKDKKTGPIIQQLEMVRSGVLAPEQMFPAVPDFQTMTSVPMFSEGGYTGGGQTYTSNETNTAFSFTGLANIEEDIHFLREYLSDPRNRQAMISYDLLRQHDDEMSMIDRMKTL